MKAILKIGLLWVILFSFSGCAVLSRLDKYNGYEASYCGGNISCGWIEKKGRPVSADKDLQVAGAGYLDADMNYYYNVCDTLPAVVLKLSKDYTLDDVRWKPITDHKMFLTLIQYMKTMAKENGGRELLGFTIKANDRRSIGLWYADEFIHGKFRLGMLAHNKVYVHAPNVVTNNVFAKMIPKTWDGNTAISQVIPPSPEIMGKNQREYTKCQGCHHDRTSI